MQSEQKTNKELDYNEYDFYMKYLIKFEQIKISEYYLIFIGKKYNNNRKRIMKYEYID